MQQGIVRYINSLNGKVLRSQLKLVNQVLGEIKTRLPRGRAAGFIRPAAGSGKGGSLSLEAQALVNAVNKGGVRPEQIGDILLAYQRSPHLTKPNLQPNIRVAAMNDAIKYINVQGMPSKLSEAAKAVREFNGGASTRIQGSHKARTAALKLRRLRESRSSQNRRGLQQGLSNFNYEGGQGGNSSASSFSWSRSRHGALRAGFKEVAQVAADAVPAVVKHSTSLPGRVGILLAASAAKSVSGNSRVVQELQAEIPGISASDVQKGIVLVKKRVQALREQALGV